MQWLTHDLVSRPGMLSYVVLPHRGGIHWLACPVPVA